MGDLIAQVAANSLCTRADRSWPPRWKVALYPPSRERVACHLFWRARSGPQPAQPAGHHGKCGNRFTVPALPAYTQSPLKLGGVNYLAKITSTGAEVAGKKQYSLDGGGTWSDYESRTPTMHRWRARPSRCAKCSAAPCMTQAVARPDGYRASVRHPRQPLTWRRETAGW